MLKAAANTAANKKGKREKTMSVAEDSSSAPTPTAAVELEKSEVEDQTQYDSRIVHPASIGYRESDTGYVSWNTSKISPVFAGRPWQEIPATAVSRPSQPRSSKPDVQSQRRISNLTVQSSKPSDFVTATAAQPIVDLPPHQSENALYLQENVWHLLEPALGHLLQTMKYHVAKDVRGNFEQITQAVEKTDFNAVKWLGFFLKRNNPRRTNIWSTAFAAIKIQAAFRGFLGRKKAKQAWRDLEQARAQQIEMDRRNKAATLIQACYRGHSVRILLSNGEFPRHA